METWQLIISVCAGLITIMTFFDKVGLTKSAKKVDCEFKELKRLPEQIKNLSTEIEGLNNFQKMILAHGQTTTAKYKPKCTKSTKF